MPDDGMKKLEAALRRFSHESALLRALSRKSLSPADKPLLEHINHRIETLLGGNVALMTEWKRINSGYLEAIIYGTKSGEKTAAAMLLAGAAIVRKDIANLRPDLSASIREARESYQTGSGEVVPVGGSKSKRVVGLDPFAQRLADAYNVLFAKLTPGSSLDAAIKTLLTDGAKVLRVSAPLHTLDLGSIQAALSEYFPVSTAAASAPELPGNDSQRRQTTAPQFIDISPARYRCIATQSALGTDNVFWQIFVYRLKNVQAVYNEIDAAIQSGATGTITIHPDWEIVTWQSPLTPAAPGTQTTLNAGAIRAIAEQGFCPWVCSAICIADHNESYKASQETLDQIGAACLAAGIVAGAVTLIPGVDVAAWGAVAAMASFYAAAICIDKAIISICNALDENCTIGIAQAYGIADYIDIPSGSVTTTLTCDGSAQDAAGRYEMDVIETRGPQVPADRTWRIDVLKGITEKTHDPTGWGGGKGEDEMEWGFSTKLAAILHKGVDYPHDGDARHAEWVVEPAIEGTSTVKAIVHWGVKGSHAITYTAWVQCFGWKKAR